MEVDPTSSPDPVRPGTERGSIASDDFGAGRQAGGLMSSSLCDFRGLPECLCFVVLLFTIRSRVADGREEADWSGLIGVVDGEKEDGKEEEEEEDDVDASLSERLRTSKVNGRSSEEDSGSKNASDSWEEVAPDEDENRD